MRVEGPYEYAPPPDLFFGYRHQRAAQQVDEDPQDLWRQAGGLPGVRALGQNIRNALVLVGNIP